MTCHLCGFHFEPKAGREGCAACFLTKNCGFVRCPNCFYEMAPSAEFPQILKLSELPARTPALVAEVDTRDRSRLRKLIAMGLLPGTVVSLVRRFPSYVFETEGHSFCLDEELVNLVQVTLHPKREATHDRRP